MHVAIFAGLRSFLGYCVTLRAQLWGFGDVPQVKLTLIARVNDGLPLAEGLDTDKDQDLDYYKQQAKVLATSLRLVCFLPGLQFIPHFKGVGRFHFQFDVFNCKQIMGQLCVATED